MNKSFQDRIERLRLLSQAKPSEHYEKLTQIQKQTKMIGQIFGVFAAIDEKTKQSNQELTLDEMSFEEKRRLYQAEFPNKVSPQKRAEAREALNQIAQNPQLLVFKKSTSPSSEPKVTANVITSRSWPSTSDSEEFLGELTAPRIESKRSSVTKTTEVIKIEKKVSTTRTSSFKSTKPFEVDSRFNGVWKFGNFDNFAKIVPPTSDESETSTIYDGKLTPIQFDPELATPLHTCVE